MPITAVKDVQHCSHNNHLVPREKMTTIPTTWGNRPICEDCKAKVQEGREAVRQNRGRQ